MIAVDKFSISFNYFITNFGSDALVFDCMNNIFENPIVKFENQRMDITVHLGKYLFSIILLKFSTFVDFVKNVFEPIDKILNVTSPSTIHYKILISCTNYDNDSRFLGIGL